MLIYTMRLQNSPGPFLNDWPRGRRGRRESPEFRGGGSLPRTPSFPRTFPGHRESGAAFPPNVPEEFELKTI